MEYVLGLCKAGTDISKICLEGDKYMLDLLSKVYTKVKYIKGIAFPTCISVNEVVSHFHPLVDEEYSDTYTVLKAGDVVKIDLGVQIQGFCAVIAHTTFVTNSESDVLEGPPADAVLAAYNALQASLRLFHEDDSTGKFLNTKVTTCIEEVCNNYKVSPVEGVLSHRMKRDFIDGTEVIINKDAFEQSVNERGFAFGDVFALDVVVSTGEGKLKQTDLKTSVFKRAIENTYKLKNDSSRKFLSIIENNFYSFPFSINNFSTEFGVQSKNKPVSR